MNEPVVTYRYPGIKPYTEDQQHIFHGRKGDVEKLYEMLLERPVMTLYAQSGMGKSSLINAGLIPKFHSVAAKNSFLPLRIRFGIYEPENETAGAETGLPLLPVDVLLYELKQYLQSRNMVELPLVKADGAYELWYLIKRFEVNQVKLLLIFDQAEELFTYPGEAILRLKEQLYSIANSRIPDVFDKAIGEKIKQLKAGTPEELKRIDTALELIYQPIDSRILFVVRDDMLGSFKSFEDRFPNILKDTYHLLPLTEEGASEAIRLPAMQEGRFLSLPFSFTDPAFHKLLSNLKEKDGLYDPFSIQLNCRYIERALTMNGHPEIDEADIPEEARAVNDFLEAVWKAVELVAPGNAESIRTRLTDKLIDFNLEKRISASDGPWLDRRAKPVLLKEGLIKEDNWGGVDYIELSHDRLIKSMIEESRTRRLAEQEKELLAERERASREEKLKEEALAARQKADEAEAKAIRDRDKAFRARRTGRVYLALAIIACALAVLYNVKMRRERNKYSEAFTRTMTSNAEIAYRDNNDALAFNLIQERDATMDSAPEFPPAGIDWNLLSYSGMQVKVRSSDSLVACLMKNRELRIFYLTDSLRRNTPFCVIPEVDKFLLPKGTADLYTYNAADTVIRRYSLMKENRKLVASLTDSMKNSSMGYDNFPEAYQLIGDGLFLVNTRGKRRFWIVEMKEGKGNTVYTEELPVEKIEGRRVQAGIRQMAFDSNRRTVYLNITRPVAEPSESEVWAIDLRNFSGYRSILSTHLVPLSANGGGFALFNYKNGRLSIFNHGVKEKKLDFPFLTGFVLDSNPPARYLRFIKDQGGGEGLSAFYDLNTGTMITNPANNGSPFKWSELGRRVQSSRQALIFLKGDSLIQLDGNGQLGLLKKIRGFKTRYYDYFVETVDSLQILCFQRNENTFGVIDTDKRDFNPGSQQVIFSDVLPFGFVYGSFKARQGVFRLNDIGGRDALYWRNFYEGLTSVEKQRYGIEKKN